MLLGHRRSTKTIVRENVLPLLITSTLVELVIKPYFRRRRPFHYNHPGDRDRQKARELVLSSGHSAGSLRRSLAAEPRDPQNGACRAISPLRWWRFPGFTSATIIRAMWFPVH